MKVSELIKELQQYPGNMKVVVTYNDYYKDVSIESTKDVKGVGVLLGNTLPFKGVDLNGQPYVKIEGEKTLIAEVLMIKSVI